MEFTLYDLIGGLAGELIAVMPIIFFFINAAKKKRALLKADIKELKKENDKQRDIIIILKTRLIHANSNNDVS